MTMHLPALTFFSPQSCDISSKVEAIPGLFLLNVGFRSLHFFLIDQYSFWLSKCIRTLNWEWVQRAFLIQSASTSRVHFVSLVHLHDTKGPQL